MQETEAAEQAASELAAKAKKQADEAKAAEEEEEDVNGRSWLWLHIVGAIVGAGLTVRE